MADMDMDEILPAKKTSGPLAELVAQDLDRMGQGEVETRIAVLEGEIARCRTRLASASALRSAADELFRKG
ncbi:hypothetical protein GCM10007973_00020 [Polymorphobacter multimanifer]|uniref:Uncharacterized small protein (DUF1192 family) n=2 Tax=Polymorphobacter multimanifer TaxID=1070431 RepID=A0A841L761_9SPHN|nr:DUF1192 family protein [Polymorphobacter multimanifer]MBB6226793.1 uncharacterized small protein (DUF1192 family) [Polymorphobacter multimanifer]GGI67003.1 hypothetical protein GCM10007973_00020 [Polymorphobacter multimanifer]